MTRGGPRENAGRRKGVPNKATADIKALAAEYTNDALQALASIVKEGESEAARVAAANAILDRAYGKPKQSVDVDAEVTARVEEIRHVVVDPRNTNA